MYQLVEPGWLRFSKGIQNLCSKPYYKHAHGCPNYGMRPECPPNASLIDRVLDMDRDIYVIYTPFEVGRFAEHMKERHPGWNNRQIYNPRYWQPAARKLHRADVKEAIEELGLEKIVGNPEGCGVNLSLLMKRLGVKLDWVWPPEHNIENVTYRISLAGYEPEELSNKLPCTPPKAL